MNAILVKHAVFMKFGNNFTKTAMPDIIYLTFFTEIMNSREDKR